MTIAPSPPRTQGPIRRGSCCASGLSYRALSIDYAVWVPAFAGTTAVLPLQARLLGRALRCFGELGRNRRGLGLAAPARRVAAVAPGARAIEGVDAELV